MYLAIGIFITTLMSIHSLNSIYYDAFDGISSDIYDLTYMKKLSFYQFEYNNNLDQFTSLNVTVGQTMVASFGSIIFDTDDMQVGFKDNDAVADFTPLILSTDINMKISIGIYAQPQSRYYQYDTMNIPKPSPNAVTGNSKSISPDGQAQASTNNDGFKLNCTFSGEGLLFNLTNVDSNNQAAHDVNSYKSLNFELINSILYVQQNNSTSQQFDQFFGISDANTSTASIKFLDIFIVSSINGSFDALIARSSNAIYIWEFLHETEVSFYLLVTSEDTQLLANVNRIAISSTNKILFGIINHGVLFASNPTDQTEAPTLAIKINEDKGNLFEKLSYIDFVMIQNSIYLAAKGEGIYIINVESMGIVKMISHPNVIGIDILRDGDSKYTYIGLAISNDPENKIKEFFVELIVADGDETNPSINKAYISNKRIDYDNAVLTSLSKTVILDKQGQRIIILLRGTPNLIDIPNYSIDLDDNFDWRNTVLNLYSFYNEDSSSYDNIFQITDGKLIKELGNIAYDPFTIRCRFNTAGIYDFKFKAAFDSSGSSSLKGDAVIYNTSEQMFNVNSTADTALQQANSLDTQTYLPILIVLILLIVVVIIVLVLKKMGIICRNSSNNQQVGPDNAHSKLPNNYETPKDNLNISGNHSNEIQIDIQHQPLEDEKI